MSSSIAAMTPLLSLRMWLTYIPPQRPASPASAASSSVSA
jgi:hypothetical protein